MVVFSIVESAAFRMFVSGLICGEPFTVIFLLNFNFNARTFSKGRFQLGNCVITCREAYKISFWYHFLKGIATPQVGYTLARIQQSCAPVEIIEFVVEKIHNGLDEENISTWVGVYSWNLPGLFLY